MSFFVDPAIADDPDTAHIRTITLSYMFFDAGEEAVARAAATQTADASVNPATRITLENER